MSERKKGVRGRGCLRTGKSMNRRECLRSVSPLGEFHYDPVKMKEGSFRIAFRRGGGSFISTGVP